MSTHHNSIRHKIFSYLCLAVTVTLSAADAQSTAALNESLIINSSPMKIGVNVSTSNYYDSGQIFKNLLFTVNPGFEGFIQQEIVGCISGSSVSCTNYYQWDQAPENYWTGATAYFCCSASASNPNLGLTRVISSSTTSSGSAGPTYTFNSPLPTPVTTDDYFSVVRQVDSTGSSGMPGWRLSAGAGGETTNIPPGSSGVQALSLSSGSCASAYADTTGSHDFVILQTGQTYGFSLKTIAISGSPTITVSVSRLGGAGGGVTPSSAILTPAEAWSTQSLSFNGNESAGTTYGDLQVQICSAGGTVYVDDADLERTSDLNSANTSVYRDEVVSSLAAINPGSLRLWDYQLGETLADWTNPLFGRHVQSSLQGQTYLTPATGRNAGATPQGLMDFLSLCELLGAKAWITIPVSWPASDYSNLIDFLAGGPETVYGAKRIANGHPATYASTLGNIYIEFGNEPWNSAFGGINMPNFSYATTSDGMLSYGHWSNVVMSAMKANVNFSPTFRLIVNMQAASTYEYTDHVFPNNSYLDAVSVAPYIGTGQLNSAGSLAAEWNPDTAFAWGDSNDAGGSAGNGWTYAYVNAETKPVYIYEDNENQIAGNAPTAILQNHAASFMAATVIAQQMLEHLKILGPDAPQHLWSLSQDQFSNSSSVSVPLYGVMKEAGGEWAGTGQYIQRPLALAAQIANDSMIGPEYAATVANPDTYTTGALNGFAAAPNVPYEFVYCFKNNNSRSCVLVNTDPSNSHVFRLTGSNVPTSVRTRILSMAGNTVDTCNNEAATPCVSIVTTSGVSVSGGTITVAPGTIEAIDFVAGGNATSDGGDAISGPPVISSVSASGLTATSATITWTTDQPSSSQVEFGTASTYGSLSAMNSSSVTSHSMTLTNLAPDTTYYYAAISADGAGPATSANFIFRTQALPAVPAPAITAVSSSGVTATSATITWTTDQPSSSQVEFGGTSGYGSLSTLSSSLVTSHSVTLSGLTPGATYNYAALSADSAGPSVSGNFSFATPPPAPVGSSGNSIIAPVGGAHNNTGTSSAPASLSIHYSSGSGNTIVAVCALGSISSSISSITDDGESPWSFRAYVDNSSAVRTEIWSTPAGGSVASRSFTVNIAGPTPASCALEEYSGVMSIGSTATAQATSGSWSVSLTTQDPNNYVVTGLGANSFYGYTAISGTIRQLGGLTQNSGNDYVEVGLCDNTASKATPVTCTSVSGSVPWAAPALELRSSGVAASGVATTSPVAPPAITSVIARDLTPTSATVTWTTDQPSSSQVEFGTASTYGSLSAMNSSSVTSHSMTLTNLAPDTTYYYAAISADVAGPTTSANFTFRTASPAPAPAPVITAVSSSSITTTSAVITWTTDQPSSSQVEFGGTSGYGSLSTLSSSLVTSHSVTLSGLTPGATYNYAALSADSAGPSVSGNFSFATPPPAPVGSSGNSIIAPVGGAHNNTGTSSAPASLSIHYSSGSGNTIVAVCALGSISSSISSITDDGGSPWSFRAYVDNSSAVRTEIWSTPAGGSVASRSFTVNIAGPTPASCALEEYSGVMSIGSTATAQATSGSWSVSLTTQDPNNYVVTGLGANSFYGYTAISGTIRQLGGLTANSGNDYVEIGLCDNTAAKAMPVTCTSVSGSVPWAAPALELRSQAN